MTDLIDHPEPEARIERRGRVVLTPRFITMVISGVVTFALLGMMLVLPVPYAVQGAGPTFNTLAGYEEAEAENTSMLINVDGTQVYPAAGELLLTTVVTSGGPGYPVRASNVIMAYVDPAQVVVPVEAALDPNLTRQERDELSAAQMITSQEHATVAALTSLGYEVPAEMDIVEAAPGSGAEGMVEAGDRVLAIAGPGGGPAEVDSYADLVEPLEQAEPGEEMTLVVERDGEQVELPIVTTDDGTGRSQLGIFLDADFEMPLQVDIAIDNVGGPSAGLMFALGIIEVLTPEDLTGGQSIAGTGTISLDGRVGPIGGVDLKMIGAVEDGAEYFLTPLANCPEVVGNEPPGLQVIAVENLDQAREAVEKISAGQTTDLPTCPTR